MVKLMLQQSPALRPACHELLGKQQLVRNHPASLEVKQEEGDTDFSLLGTIRVPRNLGQITDRLPGSQYDSQPKPRRGASLPALREQVPDQPRFKDIPGSAVSKGRGGSLAPIKERDEHIHSADLSKSKGRIGAHGGHPSNQGAGYGGNHVQDHRQRPPLGMNQHRSNLEVHNPHRVPQSVPSGKENLALPPINRGGARGISENKFLPPALAKNGAAIMGGGGLHNSNSAQDLHNNYRSGSRGSGAESRNQRLSGPGSRAEQVDEYHLQQQRQ